MSIRYLYVTQRDEEPASITVHDFGSLQPNIKDIKFMIMHCSCDAIGHVVRFLTKGGYVYTQCHATSGETFRVTAGGRFPLAELYLSLGQLQSEVILKLYLRNPIDVDVRSMLEKIETIAKRIELSDKIITDVVNENASLRKRIKEAEENVASLSEETEYINDMWEGFRKHSNHIEELSKHIEEESLRVDRIEETLIEESSRVGKIEKALIRESSRIDDLSGILVEESSRIDDLSGILVEESSRIDDIANILVAPQNTGTYIKDDYFTDDDIQTTQATPTTTTQTGRLWGWF